MKISLFSIFFTALVLLSRNCYAQETTSSDLLNNAKVYDGQIVVYKGEVIGDIMIRGDYAWLNVNDSTIAIGIWTPKDLIRDISYTGDYKKRGDTVEVIGTFHRSCLEHGGDLDIHAQAIKMVSSGVVTTRTVNKNKIYLGAISFLGVILFYVLKKIFQNKDK